MVTSLVILGWLYPIIWLDGRGWGGGGGNLCICIAGCCGPLAASSALARPVFAACAGGCGHLGGFQGDDTSRPCRTFYCCATREAWGLLLMLQRSPWVSWLYGRLTSSDRQAWLARLG